MVKVSVGVKRLLRWTQVIRLTLVLSKIVDVELKSVKINYTLFDKKTDENIIQKRQLDNCSRAPLADPWQEQMCSGSEAGSYLRLIDSCITQLKAQGPSRTCNESKEEDQKRNSRLLPPNSPQNGSKPSVLRPSPTTFERRGNHLKGLNDFYLKAKSRIWPWFFFFFITLKLSNTQSL